MKRMITAVLTAIMLVAGTATAASADTTQDALQAALDTAQDAVDYWGSEVERLDGLLTAANAAVGVQQGIVDDLEDDLEDAKAKLKVATDRVTELTEYRAYCLTLATNQLRNDCRNETNQEFNNLNNNVVPALQIPVTEAQVAYDDAKEELERLESIARGLAADKTAADGELADAIIVRDAAQEALDAYVPVAAEVHPGCKGINNAQGKVSTKGNAANALTAVATKLGCAA